MAVIQAPKSGGGLFDLLPMIASAAFPVAAPWIQAANAARMGLQGNWGGAAMAGIGAATGTDTFRDMFGNMPDVQTGIGDTFAPALQSNQGTWAVNPYMTGNAGSVPQMWNAPDPYDLVRRR
jgi:hypothetical protein